MFIKTFNDVYSKHPSYLIGCEETGDAMVIDPSADITVYLRAALRACGVMLAEHGREGGDIAQRARHLAFV